DDGGVAVEVAGQPCARGQRLGHLVEPEAACAVPGFEAGVLHLRRDIRVSAWMSTVAFFPEGAFGPTNNCVGIGDVLRRRGHRVVFIVEESFAGTLEEKGFEERPMRLAPAPDHEEEPGQFWKDFIRETAPVFRKSTLDQLSEF